MNYEICNQYISLTISDMGAEMQSIKREGREYLWNGDEMYWPERAPILFPFVGRLTEGKYLLNGREYEMDIHGFARHLRYELREKGKQAVSFELRDSDATYQMYPYHFVLTVQYELKGDEIGILYSVTNQSDATMYFGIGGHPGFRLPLDEGLEFTDYYLEFGGFSSPQRVGHTKSCFLSGIDEDFPLTEHKYLALTHDLFDRDAIVLRNAADEVTLKSEKGSRKITVSYPSLSYLGLWHTPKTEAPYICIEPWTSLASRQGVIEELRYKSDMIRLCPRGTYVNRWSIRVE